MDRYTKTKKSIYTGFELFSLNERDIPMEVLELPNKSEKIIDFAWEPKVSGPMTPIDNIETPSIEHPQRTPHCFQLTRSDAALHAANYHTGDGPIGGMGDVTVYRSSFEPSRAAAVRNVRNQVDRQNMTRVDVRSN